MFELGFFVFMVVLYRLSRGRKPSPSGRYFLKSSEEAMYHPAYRYVPGNVFYGDDRG